MSQTTPVANDINFLTETLKSSVEDRLMLRTTLESALFKLGHSIGEIEEGLDAYYAAMRTVH